MQAAALNIDNQTCKEDLKEFVRPFKMFHFF